MAKGAWKMTAARKAYYASKKKRGSTGSVKGIRSKNAGKKAFAQEYKQSRAFGASKKSSIHMAHAAAIAVSPRYGMKKAKAYGRSMGIKAGIPSFAGPYLKATSATAKSKSIQLKYGKKKKR